MSNFKPQMQGSVNIGIPILRGKEFPDPSGQELNLNPELFRMKKNESPKICVHDRIKDLIGKNVDRKTAVKIAHAEAKKSNDSAISAKDIYRHKFQTQEPGREMSTFRVQEQRFPYI